MSKREYLSIIQWQRLQADVHCLADKITASQFVPDLIIGIAYGGIIPATLLYFELPEAGFRIAYPQSDQKPIEGLPDVNGLNVLVVDDLSISGDTLLDVRQQLASKGAQGVIAVCLYTSEKVAGLDHWVRVIGEGERIVFPWYARQNEDILNVFKYRDRFGKYEPFTS